MRMDIDQDLLKEAMELGQFKSKSEAVNAALAEYVARLKREMRENSSGTP